MYNENELSVSWNDNPANTQPVNNTFGGIQNRQSEALRSLNISAVYVSLQHVSVKSLK